MPKASSPTWFNAAAPVARRVRAYFAPVNRAAQQPVLFDPSQQGGFDLDNPPAPWISLGFIQNFLRKAASKSGAIMSGIPAVAQEQIRESLGARVGFQFLSWTKLTMALATGSQHMNVLASTTGSVPEPAGAEPFAAVSVQSGSTAAHIALSAEDATQFTVGQIVAVDCDYAGQTGYLGSPITGAYLRQPLSDPDYLRRITFNVALVAGVSSSSITLAQPLPCGAPASGAKVQAVTGFVDREGGSFYHEWSALFVMEGTQGERIFFHYPRLQPVASAEESAQPLSGKGQGRLERIALSAEFTALPITDPLDNERVVCYRSFVPAPRALV
ncbi:hypothetical protein [Occallatibacter riparius]|uniref:Uncharacterized protein n=1 Tax=Occallatibacter riparius TaxID=1002689 RepID=A0A9J7BT34_9BACT|nr:hypothetical protein [Occallatibacter riparius]UWZ86036.1 hypothetical protein MOP44_08835 [Occallatibacter riparius]